MRKKIISTLLCLSLAATMCGGFATAANAEQEDTSVDTAVLTEVEADTETESEEISEDTESEGISEDTESEELGEEVLEDAVLQSTDDSVVLYESTAKTPKYQTNKRQMEKLNRGLIAVYHGANSANGIVKGVYLSWRLFGDESLTDQAFDIYRRTSQTGAWTKIKTTDVHGATNYTDTSGSASCQYVVVKAGASEEDIAKETPVKPSTINNTANSSYSEKNSFTYMDVPINRPDPVERMGDGKLSYYYTYDSKHEGGANDASVGDLDGDGEYEIVLKWDPTDSKDSAGADFTGNAYIDGYKITTDANSYEPTAATGKGNMMWRIDLGKNVTAGAHYAQFMVYDFDGDGKSEIACKTAPGSIDGEGHYVSEVGDTAAIRNVDNTKSFIGTSGRLKGKNPFTQYLTIFDGETGRALWTTEFIPYETAENKYWGDGSAKYNRSERYLAAVAYLDGATPSLIMCRGYYHDSVIRAYNWDGDELKMLWEHVGKSSAKDTTLYGQGNHNLTIGDIDNDGKDEIVYGSAALDDDGKTVLGNTKLGHGDAIHMNDFNNDGNQEVFSVKEEAYSTYAADLRNPATGAHFWPSGKVVTSSDNGRGVMDNIDDAYALTHPNALALCWDSGHANVHDLNGDDLTTAPKTTSRTMQNFLIYWDGDLGREILDDNQMVKYYADTGSSVRFYDGSNGWLPVTSNNYSKHTPSLVADIWGDWREEIIMPINKNSATGQAYLRIMTSTLPTDYRLATLMHDSQYRLSVAWQNVGYNQPTHTSYYIGSAALATDENGNKLNYLAPETPYTLANTNLEENIVHPNGVTLSDHTLNIERSKTAALTATVSPADAKRKAVEWKSSDESVAIVINGTVTAVAPGTATITATAKDTSLGTYSDTCEVTVWSNPVTGISFGETIKTMKVNDTVKLTPTITPENASDKNVKWESSNSAVATVSDDGTVTAVSMGLATIHAVTVDGNFKASCVINVVPQSTQDITGEGDSVFVTTNTDAESVFSNATSTSASLRQTNATTGGMFYKTFAEKKSGKATLSFRYVTGGVSNLNGPKSDGSNNWNWDGHEYTFYVKVLGKDGANILTFKQPYTSSAGTMTTKFTSNSEANFSTNWKTVVDGAGSIQGSSKRWIVTLEFDYDNDKCNATIVGTDSSWSAESGKYTASFPLNGLTLDKLQIESTVDGAGGITWSPDVSAVKYTEEVAIEGASSTLYKRGEKTGTEWTNDDIAGWTQVGQTTAALALDKENGRIWYNPTKPGTEYSASKTFTGISDNATLTYDIDWTFGSATGRIPNLEYLQIGSNFRIGWTSGYMTFVSTDGGTSYNGITGETADSTKSIFTGSNAVFTKNVKVVIDTATKTIKSFQFGGNEISAYTNYKLPEEATIDSVKFGFQRGGSTENWAYPNGIDNIMVTQFAAGAKPSFPISFVNHDGSILQESNVEVGETPVYTGETPTYTDEKYIYVYANAWDKVLAPVVEEAIYKALYNTTPQTYAVTLNTNGGTLVGGDVTSYTYGTEVTLPTATKEHYTFDGWCTDEECTGTAITEITATDFGAKTYYAKFTPETYTVTLTAPDAKITGNVTSYSYGTAVTLPTEVIKTGHEFGGWYDNEECTGTAITEITATDFGAKTYYAKLTPKTYTVTLNANGSTLSGDDVTSYTYGTAVTLPTATKAGYTFGGWYTTEIYAGSAVTSITATDTENKVYYAKWTSDNPVVEINSVSTDGKSANVDFVTTENAVLVGVLYDGDVVKEVKTADIRLAESAAASSTYYMAKTQYQTAINFANDVNDYTLKVFMWNSLDGMKPIVNTPAVRVKPIVTAVQFLDDLDITSEETSK